MVARLITSINRYLVDVIGDAPTANVPIGSRAYNLDDSLWYIFDGATWSVLTAEEVLVLTSDQIASITHASAPSATNMLLSDSAGDTLIAAALTNLLSALATADPHVANKVWNNAGVLTVSAG